MKSILNYFIVYAFIDLRKRVKKEMMKRVNNDNAMKVLSPGG